MRYLPDLLERITDPHQAPPDRSWYFLLRFAGPPRSPGAIIIYSALRARRQMKEQVVVQVLQHAIKIIRFAPRRLDSTDVRGVVERGQRFDPVREVDEI